MFVFFISVNSLLKAQDGRSQRLTAFVEKALEASGVVPGLSVSVAGPNGALYSRGFGLADLDSKAPVTPHTPFYIASCTKAYTGLLAAVLHEEGEIDLDRALLSYRPFRDFEGQAPFDGLTVRSLLHHQTGLANNYLSFPLAYSGQYTEAHILQLIEEETTLADESRVFEYSNLGYYLFDALLRAELGKSWREMLQEKVLLPAGLSSTSGYVSSNLGEKPAVPYRGLEAGAQKAVYLRKTDATMHAAGGLLASGADAAVFLSLFLGKEVPGLPAAALAAAHTRPVLAGHEFTDVFQAEGYGLGWRTGEYAGQGLAYHFGGYPGFFANYSFMPEAGLGVAVLSNFGLSDPLSILVTQYAYDLYLGNERALQRHERNLLKTVRKPLRKYRKGEKKHQRKLAARQWQLSLPTAVYAGTYKNEKVGEAVITAHRGQLRVEMGNLMAKPTPYPCEDCMRLELIPGWGMVVQFEVADGQPVSVQFGGDRFERID